MDSGGQIRRATPAGRLPEAMAAVNPRHEATAIRGSQTGQPARAFKVGHRKESTSPDTEEQLACFEEFEK